MIHQNLEPVLYTGPRCLPEVPEHEPTPEGAVVSAGISLAALSVGARIISAFARHYEWDRTAGTLRAAANVTKIASPIVAGAGIALHLLKTRGSAAEKPSIGSGRYLPIDEIEPANY